MGSLYGVKNNDSKCFAISTTQAMSAVPSLSNFFLASAERGGHHCSMPGNCLVEEMGKIFRQLKDPTRQQIIDFGPVEELLVNSGLRQDEQDANEFQTAVFDTGSKCEMIYHRFPFDSNTSRHSDSSGLHHIDSGLFQMTRMFSLAKVYVRYFSVDASGHSRSVLGANYSLRVELRWKGKPIASSVQEALNHYVTPERIDFKCDTCDETTALRTSRIEAPLPRVLCLQLKRFTNEGNKVTGPVSFDFILCLPGHSGVQFHLYSIVCHSARGGGGGHYVAFFRKKGPGGCEQWYKADDAKDIEPVQASKVLAARSGVYLLYYERQPTSQEVTL